MPETSPDKKFENSVYDLLKLIATKVQRERLLGSKKVDLLFEVQGFSNIERYAVECKLYSKNLEKSDLEKIHASYIGIRKKDYIDRLLIITKVGLSPAGLTYIDENKDFLSHSTYEELQSRVMDFGLYVQGIIKKYEESAVSQYYVPMLDGNGKNIEEYIYTTWIHIDFASPIAVLGGYGVGKTTLSSKLSYEFAQKVINNPYSRIPIIIKLGDISNEQSLEGLLGKVFTTTMVVKNYSFDAFMSLNAAGRFVIILDGFDEMKHGITWENFKYNFYQLNRLHSGRSKVILLGRPTAFMSDNEHNFILNRSYTKGAKSLSPHEYIIDNEDLHNYHEIIISYFTLNQIKIFLEKYSDYLLESNRITSEEKKIYNLELENPNLYDIAKRPVQLKMLVDVLPQINENISALTSSKLYDTFINFIIEREHKKSSRLKFSVKQRRQFARELAWHMWIHKKTNISADKIPDPIFNEYKSHVNQEYEGIKRDLITACFLERKLGDSLYFPHRSFQEFLVAENLYQLLKKAKVTMKEVIDVQNEEVCKFLSDIILQKDVDLFDNALALYEGCIPASIAMIIVNNRDFESHFKQKAWNTENPWPILLLSLKGKFEIEQGEYYEILKTAICKKAENPKYTLLVLVSACRILVDELLADIILLFALRYKNTTRLQRYITLIKYDKNIRIIAIKKLLTVVQKDIKMYCSIDESWELEYYRIPPSVVHFERDVDKDLLAML